MNGLARVAQNVLDLGSMDVLLLAGGSLTVGLCSLAAAGGAPSAF